MLTKWLLENGLFYLLFVMQNSNTNCSADINSGIKNIKLYLLNSNVSYVRTSWTNRFIISLQIVTILLKTDFCLHLNTPKIC